MVRDAVVVAQECNRVVAIGACAHQLTERTRVMNDDQRTDDRDGAHRLSIERKNIVSITQQDK